MLKKDLVAELIKKFPQFSKKDMGLFVDTFFGALKEGIKANRIELRGFGVFTSKVKPSRQMQHPKTKKIVKTSPHRAVRFKSSFEIPLEVLKKD
ncbi:MAG: integration host factor subunit beta [Candidatus Desulfofervidaceae bacterium]|nr:integration host factor subunit beta [Candidatus Desulfofervidaceae bacterium]MDL1970633.1 integration host factor subunit beta [Candidatus Desulfofervidaceae bacterium]